MVTSCVTLTRAEISLTVQTEIPEFIRTSASRNERQPAARLKKVSRERKHRPLCLIHWRFLICRFEFVCPPRHAWRLTSTLRLESPPGADACEDPLAAPASAAEFSDESKKNKAYTHTLHTRIVTPTSGRDESKTNWNPT